MRRPRVYVTLLGALWLVLASVASAQQTPQPVVRLGNWLEVGNDVFMHIIGTADIRYKMVHNFDFESHVRDRTVSRSPSSTSTHEGDSDLSYAELRLGAEFRYQKNLQLYLLFEHQQVFDGNLIDDRSNTSNPGGNDIFGRAAATENPGFHIERYWIDYKFSGTPLRLRVGADVWQQDQAALVGDDDPRFALFGDFGDIGVMAAAVIQNEAQRLGLENDNDFTYYTFSGWYNLKPHKFQLDVTYFRDRFAGADTQAGAVAFRGQKNDSVLLMASWSGTLGPVRALVQGNILTGKARGGTGVGLPAGATASKDYDIFAGSVVAYAEADFGIVRPFVGFIYGSGDGDPTDDKLHGFMTLPVRDVSQITASPFFNHLDTSHAFATRDYSCPARLQGLAARTTLNQGAAVLGAAGFECAHSSDQPFNDSIGNTSHLGINSTYSNPGTFNIPVGLRVFPFKGHEITGWYVYRGMAKSQLLDIAFAPELAAQGRTSIGKTLYHEIGGFWQWTLNSYFDIRLSGNIGIPGDGYKDIAQLADCNLAVAGVQRCQGDDIALSATARFRARF